MSVYCYSMVNHSFSLVVLRTMGIMWSPKKGVYTVNKQTINARDAFKFGTRTLMITMYGLTIGAIGILTPSTAYAAQEAMNFSIEQQAIFNIEQDDLPIALGSKEVPEQFVGSRCTVEVESLNNHSIHPGNDLTVSSNNGESIVFEDVERETDLVIVGSDEMNLGSEVNVDITAIGGKTFSGGMNVKVTCPDEVEPQNVERCDTTTGKIVEVDEEEATDEIRFVSVGDDECQPEEPSTPTEKPETLPVTGAASFMGLFAGTSIAGTVVHALISRRQS